MKRWGLLAGALLMAPALGAQSGDVGIQSRKLANGLEVLVIENHAVPLVTIELDVKNGAFTEGPEFSGLSHLYEHMFFKANRTIPSQEAYLRRLNQLGAAWNGTTSEERVNYYITVGVDSLVPSLQFMEDAIRYPLFKQEELVSHAEEMGLELMEDTNGAIIIMDDKDLTKFVNLLNEDYYESPMTGMRYEIVKKKPLKLGGSGDDDQTHILPDER